MFRPQTDTARVSILETLVHGVVSVTVIASATVLEALQRVDTGTYAATLAAGIAVSGGVSALHSRITNGKVIKEAASLNQIPGGKRATDPPRIPLQDGNEHTQAA